MSEIKFGRLENPDERDKLFPVSAILTETPNIPEKYWWADGWWGNQGRTSQCFMGDTKILMSNGTYKKIQDIHIGDEVITHKGNYKKVIDTYSRHYGGDMVGIKRYGNKNLLYSTPEHPYYVSTLGTDWSSKKSKTYGQKIIKQTNWISASNLREKVHGVKSYVGETKHLYYNGDKLSIGDNTITITYDLMYFIGLYLTGGWVDEKHNNTIKLAFHKKEIKYHTFVKTFLLENFVSKVNTQVREEQNCTIISCHCVKLLKILDILCGKYSHGKYVNDVLFTFENSLLQRLLDGFNDGNGYEKYNNEGILKHTTLTTVSKTLSQNLYDICLRLGYNVSLNYQDSNQKDNCNRRRCYRIYMYHNTHHSQHITENDFVTSPIKKISNNFHFCGLVYNIEVEDDHSYIADNCVVHNCVVYSWSHWIEDGPVIQDGMINRSKPMYNTTQFYNECQKRDPWPGECVDMETQCMTTNGWKFYDEITIGDNILTFNLTNKKLEFTTLDEKFKYDDAQVSKYGHKNIEVVVTDNHKWPVTGRNRVNKEYTLCSTSELNSNHVTPLHATFGDFPKEKKYTDWFVKLVAWTITEGSFRPAHRRGTGITISKSKYVNDLQEILIENNIHNSYWKDDLFVCEFSGEISKEIRKICEGKNVNYDFIFDLTKEQMELFLAHMELGDGSLVISKSQKPRRLFHQLIGNGNVLEIWQMCNVLLGNPISRTSKKNYINKTLSEAKYTETWGVRTSPSFIEWGKVHKISTHKTDVWCPRTVNGTFVAKRGKNVFITGNSYDGTSVRTGAKILKHLGIINEYRWAQSIDDVVNTVLTLGPMVVGTKWYNGMSKPNSKGIITPTGSQNGGHAYLINGVDKNNRYLRIKNSWGKNWGKKGYAFISFDDFEKLLNDGGEACIAFENKMYDVPDLSLLPPA